MGNSTNSSMWPISQPSSEVKQLVNCFFTLVDTNSQEVGKTLADAIFTQDGVFITANGTFQGAAEISQSRVNAWTTVKIRQHKIWKYYVNDSHGMDIFIVGNLEMETSAGTKANLEFVARMEIQQQDSGPRICKYQVVSPAPQVSRPIVSTN